MCTNRTPVNGKWPDTHMRCARPNLAGRYPKCRLSSYWVVPGHPAERRRPSKPLNKSTGTCQALTFRIGDTSTVSPSPAQTSWLDCWTRTPWRIILHPRMGMSVDCRRLGAHGDQAETNLLSWRTVHLSSMLWVRIALMQDSLAQKADRSEYLW